MAPQRVARGRCALTRAGGGGSAGEFEVEAESAPFPVTGAPVSLTFGSWPTSAVTLGANFSVAVWVYDAHGNRVGRQRRARRVRRR